MSDQGYIYILSNPAFKDGLFKIGMTTRSADSRAFEIYTGSTGVPAPFKVEYTFPVSRCALAEQRVFEELRDYRYSEHRGFFEVPKKLARQTIATVGTKINEQFGEPTPPKIDKEDWVVETEGVAQPKVGADKPRIVVKSHTRTSASAALPSQSEATIEPMQMASQSKPAAPDYSLRDRATSVNVEDEHERDAQNGGKRGNIFMGRNETLHPTDDLVMAALGGGLVYWMIDLGALDEFSVGALLILAFGAFLFLSGLFRLMKALK